MGLYLAAIADRYTFLYFDKRSNKTAVSDFAIVKIARFDYADILAEGYIFNTGVCDCGIHCSEAAV